MTIGPDDLVAAGFDDELRKIALSIPAPVAGAARSVLTSVLNPLLRQVRNQAVAPGMARNLMNRSPVGLAVAKPMKGIKGVAYALGSRGARRARIPEGQIQQRAVDLYYDHFPDLAKKLEAAGMDVGVAEAKRGGPGSTISVEYPKGPLGSLLRRGPGDAQLQPEANLADLAHEFGHLRARALPGLGTKGWWLTQERARDVAPLAAGVLGAPLVLSDADNEFTQKLEAVAPALVGAAAAPYLVEEAAANILGAKPAKHLGVLGPYAGSMLPNYLGYVINAAIPVAALKAIATLRDRERGGEKPVVQQLVEQGADAVQAMADEEAKNVGLHAGAPKVAMEAAILGFVDELAELQKTSGMLGKGVALLGAGAVGKELAGPWAAGRLRAGTQDFGQKQLPQFYRRFGQHQAPPSIGESILMGGERMLSVAKPMVQGAWQNRGIAANELKRLGGIGGPS